MAKVKSATVRLVLKKCRANKNGEYPIYLVVCFGGRMEKSTGIACKPGNWDLRRECVKNCSNAPVLNKMLLDMKNRVIERKNDYEFKGKSYTPSMLLEDCEIDLSGRNNVYKDLMEAMISERKLRKSSARIYRYTYTRLMDVMNSERFLVDEVTASVMKGAVAVWKRSGIGDTTLRDICGHVGSVMHYAISKGIIEPSAYPFIQFPYSAIIKANPKRTYYLDNANLVRVRDYFFDMVIERNGKMWHYREGAEDKLMKRYTKEFALLYWLMCYKLGGLAPCDVALLKTDNVSRIVIDGEEYYCIDSARAKTGVPIHTRIKRDLLCIIGLEHYLGTAHLRDNYVYPILQNNSHSMAERDEQSAIVASQKCTCEAIKKVRECMRDINAQTIRTNVSEGLQMPLISVEEVVYYSARHTLANSYLQTPGANIHSLASIMARSPAYIGTYLHQLRHDSEIADAMKDLPI